MRQKRILITGCHGMLGRSLQKSWHDRFELSGIDLNDADITDFPSLNRAVASLRPEVIVHCAAMTAVDACENDRETAYRVNRDGAANIASAARETGARLIAISTDYVFSGRSGRPWKVEDAPDPQTVYGHSKLLGEEAVRRIMPGRHVIARTAWLYGPGGPSFLHSMLKLAAENRPQIRVVNDQCGSPTSTAALGAELAEIILHPQLTGTFHLSCEGACTWFDFAREIFRLNGGGPEVVPCSTAEYPRPAPRPAYSVLDKSRLAESGLPPMPDWRRALADFFARGEL